MTVTAAKGFRAAGVAAGLRARTADTSPANTSPANTMPAPDVALVVNDGPSYAAAGVFTRNRVQAAPVLWSREVLRAGELRAVVLNAGGANACTGPEGFQDTHATAEAVAELLGCGAGEIAVCSTGLIGTRLPMELLLDGVAKAAADLSDGGGDAAADAIRTTDTVAKVAARRTNGVTTGGMAKGAGMLAPSLATMLAVITTDAVADAPTLQAVLQSAAATTFERVDSDGCLSTNDTVLLLASGASGRSLHYDEFAAEVTAVCADLARQLVADAEGASKEIAVEVRHAANEADAVEVGRAVARNNLLKCALHGEDPNWGRVLAAVGTTAAAFRPEALEVAINGVWVCIGCAPGEPREQVDLSGREVRITINLHAGDATATVWTNDLTADYVHENSAYST